MKASTTFFCAVFALLAQAAQMAQVAQTAHGAQCPPLVIKAGQNLVQSTKAHRAREILAIALDHAVWHASFNEADRSDLIAIHRALPQEDAPLQFVSFQQNAMLFAHLGPTRAAATGDHVGDPIYINTDVAANFELSDYLALLVHEYGHHHGHRDEEFRALDSLGVRVAQALNFEEHSLSEFGAPGTSSIGFQLKERPSSFQILTHPRRRDDVGKRVHMSERDYGYGTHLLISDGHSVIDARDVISQGFDRKDQVIYLSLEPQGWKVEAAVEDGATSELVLRSRVSFSSEVVSHYEVEMRIPVEIDASGNYRFSSDRAPYMWELVQPYRQLVDAMRAKFFMGAIGAELAGRDVKLRDLPDRIEVEMTFDGQPDPVYLHIFHNVEFFWGQRQIVDGTEMLSLLPASHPLRRNGQINLELLEDNRSRITITFPPQAHRHSELSFLGAVFYGGFKDPANPFVSLDRAVIPEMLPTLSAKSEAGRASSEPIPLKHVGSQRETKITLPIEQSGDHSFDLTVEVPSDFPIHSDQDLAKFSDERGGSLKVLLHHPNVNYNIAEIPAPIGKSTKVYFREPRQSFEGQLDFDFGNGPTRQIRLPLDLVLRPELYLDVQHETKYNTHTAPKELRIKGLLFQNAELQSWYLPVDVDVSFDHSRTPPVSKNWVVYSREAEELRKNPIQPELFKSPAPAR